MLMITKKGLKLWGSGMIMLIMGAVYSFLIDPAFDTMSLGELAFCTLVLLPLATGWAQKWYWTRGADDAVQEDL